MRMIKADDLEQALREAGFAEVIKDDCSKCTSAWGVPIVDAEPVKHGRWEVVDGAEPRRYGCSVCKKLSWTEDNYCPHCGCKMDEVAE